DGERIPPINMSRHFKLNLLNDVRIMGFRGSFFMSTFSMQGHLSLSQKAAMAGGSVRRTLSLSQKAAMASRSGCRTLSLSQKAAMASGSVHRALSLSQKAAMVGGSVRRTLSLSQKAAMASGRIASYRRPSFSVIVESDNFKKLEVGQWAKS
ncbi:hypothetical protein, partial [Cohnella terricola]|uniref:hypothetical protein n=1 Tax=Cohnella terricola TaxID=1289167 RepID=UPI0016491820